MKSDARRVAFLLAASGLSDQEIQDELKLIERFGLYEFMRSIRAIRQSSQHYSNPIVSNELPAFITGPAVKRPAVGQIVDQVIRLLVKEARLAPNIAAELLTKSFRRRS